MATSMLDAHAVLSMREHTVQAAGSSAGEIGLRLWSVFTVGLIAHEGESATYAENVAGVTLDAVNREATALFDKRPLSWLVVGDRSEIESGIRELDLGKVRVIDADDKPVE
jgi:hypothetical protein